MKATTILAGVGILIAGAAIYSYDYVRRTRRVFESMRVYVTNISDVSLPNPNTLNLKLSFMLENVTAEGFTVTTGRMAKLNSLAVHYNGQYLGSASLNMAELSIEPNSATEITGIPFTVSTTSVLQTLLSGDLIPEKLILTAYVDVLGTTYAIENQPLI